MNKTKKPKPPVKPPSSPPNVQKPIRVVTEGVKPKPPKGGGFIKRGS
jgi:hypothetical protein